MDGNGNWYKENVVRPNSPNYNENIANEVHAPLETPTTYTVEEPPVDPVDLVEP